MQPGPLSIPVGDVCPRFSSKVMRRRRCAWLIALIVLGFGAIWTLGHLAYSDRTSVLINRSKILWNFVPVETGTSVPTPQHASGAVHKSPESTQLEENITHTSVHVHDGTDTDYPEHTLNTTDTAATMGAATVSSFTQFPRVFIIGFGKAGTKALFETLKLHPQFIGPSKEMRFFSRHYSNGMDWYLKALPPPTDPNQLVIEKSPDYVTTRGVALQIKKASQSFGVPPSSLKFIVITKNPVVRSVSEYLEWNNYRQLTNRSLLPPFSQLVLTSQSEVDTSIAFINSSLYAYHINVGNWFNEFSRSQFCFVNGDNFKKDPCLEAKKLEKCLGVDPYLNEYNFVYNPKTKKYCLRDRAGVTRCFAKSKGRKHPRVPKAVVDKLKTYFHRWNVMLYDILSEDYGWEGSEDT